MSIPITVDDFVAIGERYLSEDIINEADRLLPIATADIHLLATRGYGQSELSKLQRFRATLVAEAAGRNQQRGSKKGSRSVEAQAIKDGKLVLRSGETCALTEQRRAHSDSLPPEGVGELARAAAVSRGGRVSVAGEENLVVGLFAFANSRNHRVAMVNKARYRIFQETQERPAPTDHGTCGPWQLNAGYPHNERNAH